MDTQPGSSGVTLPPEVYRDITAYLHPHEDTRTLSALSAVSPTLRHEAQRVLFSLGPFIVLHRFQGQRETYFDALFKCHESFLTAILGKTNTALAGYVRQYNYLYTSSRFPRGPGRSTEKLAKLFIEALPLMRNLKSLCIPLVKLFGHRKELSRISSFQLDRLTILDLTSASLTRFLQCQGALRHLHIDDGVCSLNRRFFDVRRDMFPQLTSLETGNLRLWATLAETHNITAVFLQTRNHLQQRHIAALSKVEYLRLGNEFECFGHLRRIAEHVQLKVKVLRFDSVFDINKTIEKLAGLLGKLQVLIVWDTYSSPRVNTQNPLIFSRAAETVFSLSTSLRYVVTPDNTRADGAHLYERSADVSSDGQRFMTRYIVDVTNDVHPSSEQLWWVKWADILSGKAELALRYDSPIRFPDS